MPYTPSEPWAVHGLIVPQEDCEKTPASVRSLVARQQETIAELLKQNEELFRRNEALLQRVEELEVRIG